MVGRTAGVSRKDCSLLHLREATDHRQSVLHGSLFTDHEVRSRTVFGSKFCPPLEAGRLAGREASDSKEGARPVDPFLKLVTFMLLDPRTWFFEPMGTSPVVG